MPSRGYSVVGILYPGVIGPVVGILYPGVIGPPMPSRGYFVVGILYPGVIGPVVGILYPGVIGPPMPSRGYSIPWGRILHTGPGDGSGCRRQSSACQTAKAEQRRPVLIRAWQVLHVTNYTLTRRRMELSTIA